MEKNGMWNLLKFLKKYNLIYFINWQGSYFYEDLTYSILNIPKPKGSYMMWKVTNDDKAKEGMIYVLEVGEKDEIKIVNDWMLNDYLNRGECRNQTLN